MSVPVRLGPTRRRHPARPHAVVAGADGARRRSALPVALVSMPFAPVARPSIQLGLLAELARRAGFPAIVRHLHLDLAARLGVDRYQALGDHRAAVGDWLFSVAAFGDDAPDPDGTAFLDRFGDGLPGVAELAEIRDVVIPRFLDEVVVGHAWDDVAVVGFTSTFQQNVASFALAKRLKERRPDLVAVFGGANFDGVMGREWLRAVPAVDLVVSGEADRAFPALLAALAEGRDPADVPGVLVRRGGAVVGHTSAPFESLDDLPVPDYAEYFERAERVGLLGPGARREVTIPFEGARGCWWGEKRHCTFCGLNGQTMAFRAKSPERVTAEVAELVRRHGSYELNAVDNIVAPSVLTDVLPGFEATGATYRLFYEVKANLSRHDLVQLRAGGVGAVQPGIESLSSPVLALMRKGTRASTNVNLLRWARHLGLVVHWNLLWGFPGERIEHYEAQARLAPLLAHLQPPGAASRIWMERFSPLFGDRDAVPASALRPDPSLAFVYPASVRLDDAAYFFELDTDRVDVLADEAYEPLVQAVAAWRRAWSADEPPSLTWWSAPGLLQVDDRRDPADPGVHTFHDPLSAIYLACAEAPTKAVWVRDRLDLPHDVDELEEVLDGFCERGLMVRDGNLFLALAVPATGGFDDERWAATVRRGVEVAW